MRKGVPFFLTNRAFALTRPRVGVLKRAESSKQQAACAPKAMRIQVALARANSPGTARVLWRWLPSGSRAWSFGRWSRNSAPSIMTWMIKQKTIEQTVSAYEFIFGVAYHKWNSMCEVGCLPKRASFNLDFPTASTCRWHRLYIQRWRHGEIN